jgi:hypothetical protein
MRKMKHRFVLLWMALALLPLALPALAGAEPATLKSTEWGMTTSEVAAAIGCRLEDIKKPKAKKYPSYRYRCNSRVGGKMARLEFDIRTRGLVRAKVTFEKTDFEALKDEIMEVLAVKYGAPRYEPVYTGSARVLSEERWHWSKGVSIFYRGGSFAMLVLQYTGQEAGESVFEDEL